MAMSGGLDSQRYNFNSYYRWATRDGLKWPASTACSVIRAGEVRH